jgi:hypothetical protein
MFLDMLNFQGTVFCSPQKSRQNPKTFSSQITIVILLWVKSILTFSNLPQNRDEWYYLPSFLLLG